MSFLGQKWRLRTHTTRNCLFQFGLFLYIFSLQNGSQTPPESLSSSGVVSGLHFSKPLYYQPALLPMQVENSPEYQIKAVFLFNFIQFVDWPADAFVDIQTPFVIGILGKDPFGPYLDETVRDESVAGHRLTIQHCRSRSDIRACHILFVSKTGRSRLREILTNTKAQPILTVSDAPEFADMGGIIQFVTVKNKIGLRINVDAAKASGLMISSKVLNLAELVSMGN